MTAPAPAFEVLPLKTKRGWFQYNFVLIGPDDLVWGQAEAACSLRKRCKELNRAHELGELRKAVPHA